MCSSGTAERGSALVGLCGCFRIPINERLSVRRGSAGERVAQAGGVGGCEDGCSGGGRRGFDCGGVGGVG